MANLTVWIADNVATAARRARSAALAVAGVVQSADRAPGSGPRPASEATMPAASSRRRSAAGTARSLPGAPPAIMQASRIARPAHAHSAAAAPPHAPAADRELHQRVPAGAQPQDGSPDRAFHLTGPSPDTSATSTLPPRVPRGTGSKVPGNSSPKASGLPPMPWRPGTARHGTASRPSLPTTFRLAVPLRPLPAAALPAITHRRWAHKAPRYVPCAPPSARTDDQYRSAGVCASPK
jgi:hypothetical protein